MNKHQKIDTILRVVPGLIALGEAGWMLVLDTYGLIWDEQGYEQSNEMFVQDCVKHATDEVLADIDAYLGGQQVDDSVVGRLWPPGHFRLFLSHLAAEKSYVTEVERKLRLQGVAGFVAHEAIKPSVEWQQEIVSAMKSCDALAAFLHPKFHESDWTDQEVGYVLGRGQLVIPVICGTNPYGFAGSIQGIQTTGKKTTAVAVEIVDTLIGSSSTQSKMVPIVVRGFVNAKDEMRAKNWVQRLQVLDRIPNEQLEELGRSLTERTVIQSSADVTAEVRALLARHNYQPAPPVYATDEEPF